MHRRGRRSGVTADDTERRRGGASWPSARRAASARCASRPSARPRPRGRRRRPPTPLRRRHATTRSRRRRSGATRVVKGIALADYAALLDERATFIGQWGLRGARGGDGPSLRGARRDRGPAAAALLARPAARPRASCDAAVVYGYFPVRLARATTLIVLDEAEPDANELHRFTFPRQQRDRRLCLADFFRSARTRGRSVDVVPLQLVTDRASRSRTSPTSCSRRTPTATTSRCTACRCSSPRRWPSTGTAACARS